MPVNIEWKARVRDAHGQRALAERLSDKPVEILDQIDTFFNVSKGRLKLRQLASNHAELIFYERSDQATAKASHYSIAPTSEPERMRETLARACGIRGEVRKRRWLYRHGPARIHFDEVEGLGTFLEVEVVLTADQDHAAGQPLADWLREQLHVAAADLLDVAYMDLLDAR